MFSVIVSYNKKTGLEVNNYLSVESGIISRKIVNNGGDIYTIHKFDSIIEAKSRVLEYRYLINENDFRYCDECNRFEFK